MMIRFVRGNLFSSKAQVLVNTVNCVGVMGKGVALAFKEKYPAMYEDYRQACEQGLIRPGKLSLYTNAKPWIINFPTKQHWKTRSRLYDIEAGLKDLSDHYQEWQIESLAMPALGCGHGGLDWAIVRPVIEKYLSNLEMDIEVYEPGSEAIPSNDEATSKSILIDSPVDLFGNPAVPNKPKRKRRRKTGA
jgi:O-acetyl-ADP-ribose deacetylase (regulator of RNase III)